MATPRSARPSNRELIVTYRMSNEKLINGAGINRKRVSMRSLFRAHMGALILGFIAIAGESAANLLQPWPLKIVLDDVLRGHESHAWVMRIVHRFTGPDTMAILGFACVAVLAIALLDAICTFGEKYLTTSVGQWVSFDLRLAMYAHIRRLSLAFHDHKRTGDLISRVTDDIEAIQSFVMNGLLGVLINVMTLVGMIGVMFYLNWKFTLIALSVVPILFAIVFTTTPCALP
jgi:ATP-binding cassette, subfamily B, bacterial